MMAETGTNGQCWSESRQRAAKFGAAQSEREQAEALQGQLTEVLQGTTDLVGIIDAHGHGLYINHAGRKALGIGEDENISRLLFTDFFPDSLRKLFQREVSRTSTHGATWRGESLFVSRDGREIPVWLAGQVHRDQDGSVRFLSAIARDITQREMIEEALRETEDKFRIVAEQSPNMIFVNRGGRIVYANERCEEVTAYTRSEFYAEEFDFLTLIAPGDRDSVRARYRRHAEGEEVEPYEYSFVTKDGERVEVIATTRLIDYEGKRAILGTATDITERRQVEEALRQRNRKLALLNQASQAFGSTLDMDQVLSIVLEEVRRVLGAVAASIWLIDAATDEIVCRQATGPHYATISGWRLASGEGLAGWVARTGEPLFVPDAATDARHFKGVDQVMGLKLRSILTVPLRVKENVTGALQVADAEAGRFSAQDLMLLESLAGSAAIAIDNARLVRTLRQRTLDLQARNVELDAFARTVAHDLKSPLSIITGFSQLLEEHYSTSMDEEWAGYLYTITQTSLKMGEIIDGLLLLAELRKAEVSIQPLDMAGILSEASRDLSRLVESRQAKIVLPDTWPVAAGYAPWVTVVWRNYLSNAITHGGQPPRVEVGAAAQPDGMIRFWVRDNGPGIPLEVRERLFTPFTRLDQARTRGYGLGLSIVRRIVEKLDGQVAVAGDTGSGSVFSFTLPGAVSQGGG